MPNQEQKPEQNQQQQKPESGVSAKRDKAKRNPSSFRKIVTEDLRDNHVLLDWFRFATTRRAPLVKDCAADRLFVFSAAERALEHGENPPALFADVITNNRRGYITQAQEDRALKRLRKLDHPDRDDRRQQEEGPR